MRSSSITFLLSTSLYLTGWRELVDFGSAFTLTGTSKNSFFSLHDNRRRPYPIVAMTKVGSTSEEKKAGAQAERPAGTIKENQIAPADGKKSKAGKRRKAKSKNATFVDGIHWTVDSDDIILQHAMVSRLDSVKDDTIPLLSNTTDSGSITADSIPSLLRFTIRGNPLPLRRHRTSRGFVYNPSAAAQQSFRTTVEKLVYKGDTDQSQSKVQPPLWGPEHSLAVSIVFRMKRPKKHFVAGKPGPGRLRPTAPLQSYSGQRTDVDNLAKFVLDSLNGVLYEDDRQIVSLHVTKLYDNDCDELCQGSTCVYLRLLQEDDLPKLLSTSFDLF